MGANNDINDLYRLVIAMLNDYGFTSELYLISKQSDSVDVEFDDKEAVEYFRTQTEKEYSTYMYVEYIRKGVRHVARVSSW